jgi:hypothetical protein
MNEEIANLTFKELCDRIRNDYNDSLSKSSYESVESLIEALKDIEEEMIIFPTATGYSYHCNVLKMQFLHAAIHYPDDRFTLRQVCEFRNLPLKKIQDVVSIWNRRKYRYLTKLSKRTSKHENVYKLRKCAVKYTIAYIHNYKLGFDLNKKRGHKPKKVEIYVSINGHGRKMGLKPKDVPDIVLA